MVTGDFVAIKKVDKARLTNSKTATSVRVPHYSTILHSYFLLLFQLPHLYYYYSNNVTCFISLQTIPCEITTTKFIL